MGAIFSISASFVLGLQLMFHETDEERVWDLTWGAPVPFLMATSVILWRMALASELAECNWYQILRESAIFFLLGLGCYAIGWGQ